MGFGSMGESPNISLGAGGSLGDGSISGIKEVERALKMFEHKVSKKVIKKAMTRTTAMFRKEVRRRTPKGNTGNLRKSVTSKVKRFGSRKGMLWGSVFFQRGGGKKGYHAHFIESGTSQRTINDYRGLKKKGYRIRARRQKVGRIKGREMAHEGFAEGTPKALRTWRRALVKEIQKVRATL
tara:strand:- start:4341 stop:4883 length:543 start_codon:yes stop_codon:yes gene_type:complete